jgi:hypothetical protein
MKKLLLAALLLSGLGACSPPTPYTVEQDVPKATPIQTAVTAYLKKTLDDPASYQPAEWGKPRAWQKDDANSIDIDSIKERSNILFDLLKSERRPRVASQKQFDETAAALKRLQNAQDSLIHTVDTTRIGTLLTHTYRAKNKTGALQLDSARFLVYKNGQVKRL